MYARTPFWWLNCTQSLPLVALITNNCLCKRTLTTCLSLSLSHTHTHTHSLSLSLSLALSTLIVIRLDLAASGIFDCLPCVAILRRATEIFKRLCWVSGTLLHAACPHPVLVSVGSIWLVRVLSSHVHNRKIPQTQLHTHTVHTHCSHTHTHTHTHVHPTTTGLSMRPISRQIQPPPVLRGVGLPEPRDAAYDAEATELEVFSQLALSSGEHAIPQSCSARHLCMISSG